MFGACSLEESHDYSWSHIWAITQPWTNHLFICAVWVLSHLSHVQLFATLWTVISRAPLPMGFSRQECWNGLPLPSQRNLPHPGIEPMSLTSPELAGGFFTTSATWVAHLFMCVCVCVCVCVCALQADSLPLSHQGSPLFIGSSPVGTPEHWVKWNFFHFPGFGDVWWENVNYYLHKCLYPPTPTLWFKITQSAKPSWERLTHTMALYFTTETQKEQSWVQH